MKKVIFLHPSSELYGADKILIYVIKNFKNFKKNVILKSEGPLVALIKEECPDVEITINPDLPIIAKKNLSLIGIFKFGFDLFKFNEVLKKLLVDDKDIIYLNTLALTPILFILPKKPKKIVHVHEILFNNNLLYRFINRVAIKYSDITICVSNAVKENLVISSPRLIKKIYLLKNGINFNEKKINTEQKFQVSSNKINFALIGRIKPSHKGQILLLEAIAKLDIKDINRSHFYFVGSTVNGQEYMLKEVIDKISLLGLSENVTLIPFIKNIENVYNEIDVVVVPSTFDDPFPTTVLEGMFFSKPIIGTNVGGIPEMIKDGLSGYIAQRDNSFDLSNKLALYIQNPAKIKQMGLFGKKEFDNFFTEEKYMRRFQLMLESFI